MEPSDYDIPSMAQQHQHHGGFGFDLQPPSPGMNFPLSGQNSIQENHVMYYFENVRLVHFLFAGNATTNITYSVSKI